MLFDLYFSLSPSCKISVLTLEAPIYSDPCCSNFGCHGEKVMSTKTVMGGRRGGSVVSASRTWDLKVSSSSPGLCTHVVFLGKILNSHSVSLHPGV